MIEPSLPRRRQKKRAATLADVGRLAGVSAMAASSVLNGAKSPVRLSADTKERIIKAAAELKYRANATARALSNRRMNTIGVATTFANGELNLYAMEIISGVLEAAANHHQNTTIFTLNDWNQDRGRLSGYCDSRIDGMILLAPVLTVEGAATLPDHTPFVAIHGNAALPGVVNIEADDEAGAARVVRQLLALGHRRIMHVSGEPYLIGAQRRLAGWRRALLSAAITPDADWLVEGSFATSSARRILADWFVHQRGKPLPSAFFCGNDAIALVVMEMLAQHGIRVPEDVSVVGFDDTLAARTSAPQLTTIRQPLREMGRHAVSVLLDQITKGPQRSPSPPVIFPAEIVSRASSGPAPQRPLILGRSGS